MKINHITFDGKYIECIYCGCHEFYVDREHKKAVCRKCGKEHDKEKGYTDKYDESEAIYY